LRSRSALVSVAMTKESSRPKAGSLRARLIGLGFDVLMLKGAVKTEGVVWVGEEPGEIQRVHQPEAAAMQVPDVNLT
jgi:hypothetical protein